MKMKNRLLWIAALLMAAGCSDTNEELFAPNGEAEPEFTPEIHYVRVGAAADGDVRASYDESLKTFWESGDEIKALMGLTSQTLLSGYNRTYASSTLALETGEGTNRGVFAGNMETPWSGKGDQYFHFLYPAAAGSLSLRANSGINAKHPATCSITIPSEQEGRWIPYMWASTGEKTSWDNLTHVDFNILNGSLAIRVYESDRTTPKQLSAITVSIPDTGTGSLVGTFTASTNDSFANAAFELTNTGRTITATGLERIGTVGGLYEYRLNVVPGTVEGLELTLTGADGTVVTRHANARTFRVNTRSGLNVYWDDATISMDRAASWYEDQTLEGGKLYLDATIAGASAGSVEEIGYTLDGTEYPVAPGLELHEQIALAAGEYTVGTYAKVNGKTILSDTKTVIVTPIPTLENVTIRSSYTNNGAVDPNNDIAGNQIATSYSLSDPYFEQNGLVESALLVYGSGSADILTNKTVGNLEWTAYSCRIVVALKNGYTLNSLPCDTIITGIPYEANFDANRQQWLGWTNNSGANWYSHWSGTAGQAKLRLNKGYIVSPRFNIPQDISVVVDLKGQYYKVFSGSSRFTVGTTTDTNTLATSDTDSKNMSRNANTVVSKTDLNGFATVFRSDKPYLSITASETDSYVYQVNIRYN